MYISSNNSNLNFGINSSKLKHLPIGSQLLVKQSAELDLAALYKRRESK